MGHTPYGYRIENGNAVIEPKEAEAVVKMCEGYLDGLSLKAAAETAGIVATHCQAKRMMQKWNITRNTSARIPDGNLQAFMPMMVSVAPTPRREKTLIE